MNTASSEYVPANLCSSVLHCQTASLCIRLLFRGWGIEEGTGVKWGGGYSVLNTGGYSGQDDKVAPSLLTLQFNDFQHESMKWGSKAYLIR